MDFIDSIKDYAIQDYQTSKVLPSITIAQAILESGWGKSTLSLKANNLFGIKKGNWTGEIITLPTKEYYNGNWCTINADFRKYSNFGESIKDHSTLLNSNWYAPVLASNHYKGQAIQLQECGYATDPNYGNLLIQIIEENELYKYDIVENVQVKEDIKSYKENGFATVTTDILNIRNYPSTNVEIVGTYSKGEGFYYDSVFINEGYYWTSYVSYTGVRRYVASRKIDNSEIYLSCI